MKNTDIKRGIIYATCSLAIAVACINVVGGRKALAATSSGNQTVTAIVAGPPPTAQAIILSPRNNQTVTTTPLVVSGTCGGTNNSVRVFLNGSLAGETSCQADGTFSLNIILNFGRNDLSAFVYDSLGQIGPNSDIVTINVIPRESAIGKITVNGRIDASVRSPSDQETSYKTETGVFTKEPFRSMANVLGLNSTSATSPTAVKTATVVAGAGVVIATIVSAQFVLYWLVNIDPTRTWAYRALARIISK